MFCNNCGNPLRKADKFCSNCGTPVEKTEKSEDPLFKNEAMGISQEQNQEIEIKIEPPTEKFDWNVHTFPGTEPRRTEDIDFDWHMDDGALRPEKKGEEIAFAPEFPWGKESEDRGQLNAPAFLRMDEPTSPMEERKAGHGAPVFVGAGPKLEVIEQRKPGSGTPAFIGVGPKLEIIEDKRQEPFDEGGIAGEEPRESEEAVKPKEEPELKSSVEEYSGWTFDAEAPYQDDVVGPKMWVPGTPTVELMDSFETEKIIVGTELEKEIFRNIETPENPTLARQTAKIDKFYTFNKKNEEFQKLLDKEYEKVKSGRGERTETFGGEVEDLRRDREGIEEPVPTIRSRSQVEEMARARELFFSDEAEGDFDDAEEGVREEKSTTQADEIKTEVKQEEESTFGEEKPQPVERELTEDEKNAEAFWAEGEAERERQEEEQERSREKSGKAGTVTIVILSIILAVLVILLAIRFFAPDSPAAKKMDEVTNKLFTVFQGEENTAIAAESDPEIASEDKTGLIQLELDKNRDGAIETIRYNSSLAFDESYDYGDMDINNSRVLTDNKWYTDPKKGAQYYDRNLVGTVIEYAAQWAMDNRDTGILKTLDIGEFRQGEAGFYVWVAEYIEAPESAEVQGETVAKKIYLVTVDGNTMNVTRSYNL